MTQYVVAGVHVYTVPSAIRGRAIYLVTTWVGTAYHDRMEQHSRSCTSAAKKEIVISKQHDGGGDGGDRDRDMVMVICGDGDGDGDGDEARRALQVSRGEYIFIATPHGS